MLIFVVGQHRHLLMIQLQAQVHQRTGVWIMISDLWDRIGGLFDLDQLDHMVRPMFHVPCPTSHVPLSVLLSPSC